MAPGGELFRYPQHFGENVLPRRSHEWLPYSVDEVRLKSSNTNSFPPGRCVRGREAADDSWKRVLLRNTPLT